MQFKDEWTERLAFILPTPSTKPMCLICQEILAMRKVANLKQYYKTKHKNSKFWNGEKRNYAMKSSYEATSRILVTSMT